MLTSSGHSSGSTTIATHGDESRLAQQLVLELLRPVRRKTRKFRRTRCSPPAMTTAEPQCPRSAAIAQVVQHIWAARTWAGRSYLLRRLQLHVQALPPEHTSKPLGWMVADFVISTRVSAATQYTYATSLRSLLKKTGAASLPLLDLVVTGLGVMANATRPKQAQPASRTQVAFLMRRALALRNDPSRRLAMSLYIAWKTASRWNDVEGLRKENFIEFDHGRRQVVIEWGSLKTNRRQRFKATMFTVIQEDESPYTLVLLQQAVAALNREETLTTKSTDQLRKWMRTFTETSQLGAHSIKRGAADELMEAAAADPPRLDPRLIPLLLKHQDALHEFPASTLRYPSRKVAMARALGTQNATKLL